MWIRLLIAVVAACATFGAGWQWSASIKDAEIAQLMQQWADEKVRNAQAMSTEMARARQRESALLALADRLRQERVDEIRRINAQHTAAVYSLRHRPEQRAGVGGVPSASDPGVGCTGEGLARRDAEFLVGFAADAARLASAYQECRVKYEAVSKGMLQ